MRRCCRGTACCVVGSVLPELALLARDITMAIGKMVDNASLDIYTIRRSAGFLRVDLQCTRYHGYD